MYRLQKILISFVIVLLVFIIAAVSVLNMKREALFAKIVDMGNDRIKPYGYSINYADASIDFLPPRVSLSAVRLTEWERDSEVLQAQQVYLYLNPLKLVFPGASPVSVHLEEFVGKIDEKLLGLLSRKPDGEPGGVGAEISIPTLVLKDGYFEILDPWKYIDRATIPVEYLYLSGNSWEGIGIIYKAGDEGITGSIRVDDMSYPLFISNLDLNTLISSKKIDIKKVELKSPVGNVSLSGYYDIEKRGMEGKLRGDLSPQRLVTDFSIKLPANLIQGGVVKFEGRVEIKKGFLDLDIDTEFVDLNISGFECRGFSSCVYNEGTLSLKKLFLNTPAGKLAGDVSFDFTSFTGKGEFDVVDFFPGKLADYFIADAGVGIDGTGKGRVQFSLEKEGRLTGTSTFRMEPGFSLLFREMNESIEWTEPVILEGETVLTDIFREPKIEIKRMVLGDDENSIALQGNLDLSALTGAITCDVDIHQVKTLGLKGVFARSGAIKGEVAAKGNVNRPEVEMSLSLRDLSFGELPAGNMIMKGSGVLGGNISLIADYSSTLGNLTFTGTFFPDKDLFFVGNLKAGDVDIGPFSSEKFLGDDLYSTLGKGAPIILPVSGIVSFEGEIFIGKETVRAKGELWSKNIRSPRLSLRSVRGDVEYHDGTLKIEGISFSALGGEVRSKGMIKGDMLELAGDLSDIDPALLGNILLENKESIVGKSLEGSFHVISKKGRPEKIEILFTSDSIIFYGAELAGFEVKGTTENDIFDLNISTSNNLLGITVKYDFAKGDLRSTIDVNEFPFIVTDRPFDGSLGEFSFTFSGSSTIKLKNIYDFIDIKQDFMFYADAFEFGLAVTPHLSSYEGDLPRILMRGAKKRGVIRGEVTTEHSDSGLDVHLKMGEEGNVFYGVKGGLALDTIPIVLPSHILASLRTDLEIDLTGDFSSFPEGTKGRLGLKNFQVEFPGQRIQGEAIGVKLEKGRFTVDKAPISSNQGKFSLSGMVDQDGDVELLLAGGYDAGLVKAIVGDVFEDINGTVLGNIRFTGKYPHIEVSGKGQALDVYIKFFGFKHPLEKVKTNITFFKDRILFDSIDSRFSGGDLEGSGEVNMKKGETVRLSFSADFYGVSFSYPQELPSELDGSIELTGFVDDMFLRGELFVNRALYSRSIYPESLLVDLQKNIDKFNAPIGKGFAINLDLECTSDGTITIENNLADATASGSFRVLGNTTRPIVIGTFETVEGEIDYSGTTYTVDRLIVDFDNPLANNPSIDALANAEKGEYTIFVEVTGRLDNYSVEFFSEPPLSKNDIVSLLSLGVTTQEYAEGDSSVTTAGVATVALAPLKTQIEEGIRTFTGFERFSVESNYSPSTGVVEPTLVVGKTVGDHLSVDVSTSLTGSGRASFLGEYRLISDLYFRGDWSNTSLSDRDQVGGELRIKKRFHGLVELGEKLFGGDGW